MKPLSNLKSKFDSAAEKLVDSLLPKYINLEKYTISSHVNLDRIFHSLERIKDFEKEYFHYCEYMNRPHMKNISFDKTHFDFVIYEKVYDYPVFILEVNGKAHIESDTKKHLDQFKKYLTDKYEIPLKTLELYTKHTDKEVELLLKELLTNISVHGNYPVYCDNCGNKLIFENRGNYPYKIQYYRCPCCKKDNDTPLTYNIKDVPCLLQESASESYSSKHSEEANKIIPLPYTEKKNIPLPINSPNVHGKIYLDVPYQEKEDAKSLGAKFDGNIRKWYYEGNIHDYPKFAKWILKDKEDAIIAYDYIYILEQDCFCQKCNHGLTIISLGIGEYIHLSRDTQNRIHFAFKEDIPNQEQIHIAWTNDEKEIPPKLLHYLKEHYYVNSMFDPINLNECFINYCPECTCRQGNVTIQNIKEGLSNISLKEELSKIRIKMIPIDSNLLLNWHIAFDENDDAYFKYAQMSYLNLRYDYSSTSITNDDYITYQELYEL